MTTVILDRVFLSISHPSDCIHGALYSKRRTADPCATSTRSKMTAAATRSHPKASSRMGPICMALYRAPVTVHYPKAESHRVLHNSSPYKINESTRDFSRYANATGEQQKSLCPSASASMHHNLQRRISPKNLSQFNRAIVLVPSAFGSLATAREALLRSPSRDGTALQCKPADVGARHRSPGVRPELVVRLRAGILRTRDCQREPIHSRSAATRSRPGYRPLSLKSRGACIALELCRRQLGTRHCRGARRT